MAQHGSMNSSKRRKLDPPEVRKNISAFAATRQQKAVIDSNVNYQESRSEKAERSNKLQRDRVSDAKLLAHSKHEIQTFQEALGFDIVNNGNSDQSNGENITESFKDDDSLVTDAVTESRVVTQYEPSEQSMLHLTTVDLNSDNFKELKDGCFHIKIAPGEKLVVLGEYGISVIIGQVTILGAILSAGKIVHFVHAAASHSLPVIRFRASDSAKAEILLHHVPHGLRSLGNLSPLFSGLWKDRSARRGSDIEPPSRHRQSEISKRRSFKILLSTKINPRNILHPITSPPEWNEILFTSTSEIPKSGKKALTMICGPKSSGKSTFARLLANSLITYDNARKCASSKSNYESDTLVALLDLDPGQPEYSPPGQLSLILLSKPNLGPPYSHPDASMSGQKVVRAHSIAAVSQSADPRLYMECAADLLSHYFSIQSTTPCPLIINTPGWVLGTGLEMLLDLVTKARPTQIIYLSQEGPQEVVQSLRTVANSAPVLTLPSQPTAYMVRTAAHLRAMQYMSYFHLDSANLEKYSWNVNPITALAPWEVKYGGKSAGILGILCMGEQPSPMMLKNTLDGTLLAIVVLDDTAAFCSWKTRQQGLNNSLELSDEEDDSEIMENSDLSLQLEEKLTHSIIVRTPEGIPYFKPGKVTNLDPCYSRTIGLALVRGIDSERQRLQILTPVAGSILKDLMASRKPIVLVSSKLDTPGWAYTEEFYRIAVSRKRCSNPQVADTSDYDWEDGADDELKDEQFDDQAEEISETVPWIEKLYGDEGRGPGAQVWRVRRDLGKTRIGD